MMRLLNVIVLFVMSYFLFSSCSSKLEVAATANEIDSILLQNTAKVPVFKDSTISNYVIEYDSFIKEYFTAIKNEDTKAIKKLQKQSEELVEKAIITSGKLNTPAQLERYDKWMCKQQKKIQLLNTVK